MANELNTTITVKPSSAVRHIVNAMAAKLPIFMWGASGIGKSDIVRGIAKAQKREIIDVRLNLWEPTDVKGIPFYNTSSNSMEWAPPAELPSDPNSTAILLLDELSSAAPATQAAAYQLILDRKIGTYKLPDGVSIVAAGNRESDRGVTYRMPAPLANRFVHIELAVNFDDWLTWAVENKISSDIIGYLMSSKQELHDFDPKRDTRAFPTPRSWSFVDRFLKLKNMSDSDLTELLAGTVGHGVAVKYMAHQKLNEQLPNVMDVLTGRVTKCEITEVSAMYSLVSSMCYELQEQHKNKSEQYYPMVNNAFEFMMENLLAEMVVVAAMTIIEKYKLPLRQAQMPSFGKFQARYKDYICKSAV